MASSNGERHSKFGLQFKLLATLALLFTAFAVAAFAWGSSYIQQQGMQDAEERAVALGDQMDAVWDYVDQNQPAANAYVQEFGEVARGLVCVTAVKSIARDFNRDNEGEIRVVALNPRNKEDSPDEFEQQALQAFAADETLEEYSGVGTSADGVETYYYLRPKRVTASCLSCHGDPAGETDPLGYKKEGLVEGAVKGAVSIRESVGASRADATSNAAQGIGLFLAGLLLVMGVMYALLRRSVVKPVQSVSAAASAYKPGAGSARIPQPDGRDEIADLARDFNAMADDLDGLYDNLEQRVEERTAELGRLNAELTEKQGELEDALAKLQEETESKDRLFASLSHDLRTPLASIIATTQLAEVQVDSSAAADAGDSEQEALVKIGEQTRTLVGMVDNILAFCRADAHGIEPHPEAVDLVDVAMHLKATMEPIAVRRGLALEVKVDSDLPLIEADQNLLMRVLQNLTTNAMKFTPEGGHVWVSVGWAEGEGEASAKVQFTVEDDGVGVAPEDLERIFEPYAKGAYAQGASVIGASTTGAGLGLSVVRQIAGAMQGDVHAELRQGGGTRFAFRFPAAVLDEEDYE